MKIIKRWREPMSALTHLLALIAIIPFVLVLIYKSYFEGGIFYVTAFSIFGVSIIALYSASTIYHMLCVKENIIKILKKIDHSMIFILIAGTYTPVCLISLRGVWGYSMLILVWTAAFFGVIFKIFSKNVSRWASTTIYVSMGWVAVFASYPLLKAIGIKGILVLILGGLIYTTGAIIYGTKYPKLNFKFFGFHEIFHLFVIGGSICHIFFMYKYVL